jgi:hypothetical protein
MKKEGFKKKILHFLLINPIIINKLCQPRHNSHNNSHNSLRKD